MSSLAGGWTFGLADLNIPSIANALKPQSGGRGEISRSGYGEGGFCYCANFCRLMPC